MTPLRADLHVHTCHSRHNDDIAFLGSIVRLKVRVGEASIKFDTFNYNQYGLAYGRVRMITPDSTRRAPMP